MREIKFRVWDDIEKKMYYPEQAKYCLTMVGRICDDMTDDGGELLNVNYRTKAMLFTGLKDKDGKEIWQSDYIKGHGAGFSTTHSEVHFTHNGAQIEIGDHWIQLSKFTEIEIIGHKYEQARKNP